MSINSELDLSADLIDVRDIISRLEELREERETFVSEEAASDEDAGGDDDTRAEYALNAWKRDSPEDSEELSKLENILEDLCGNGGDEQWEGNWYPVSLIADSYFETAMDDLLEDIGEMPKDIPSYLKITVDYDALQQDYTSTKIDGFTYWYR